MAVGAVGNLHGPRHSHADDREQHDRRHPAQDRLVVALPRVTPAAQVHPRKHQHPHAPEHDPPDRAFPQQLVAVGQTLVEAQLEGEVVGGRDQHPIHHDLGQHVPVEADRSRRAETSAHCPEL